MSSGKVDATSVNLRSEPNEGATVNAVLIKGMVVNVITTSGDGAWLLVTALIDGDTRIGWVKAEFIDLPPDDVEKANLTKLRDDLLEVVDLLMQERSAVGGDSVKAAAAQAALDRMQVILGNIQEVINTNQKLDMNAVGDQLRQSIDAQRAAGLTNALPKLTDIISRLQGEEPADPSGDGPAGPGIGGGVIQAQQNAVRRLPISQQLRDILEFAGRKTGIDVEVYSGGQPPTGPNRVGTHRHDVGPGLMGAADLFMHDAKTGRILDSDDMADREKMAAFIEEAAAAGATGIGHARGYMGPRRTHIGGGKPVAVWGAGNVRAGAPSWVIQAFEDGRARALTPAQVADGLSSMREAEGIVGANV